MGESFKDQPVKAFNAHPDARRQHPRVPFVTAVELETPTSVAYGFSENISLGGMLIRSEATLEPGTPALASFILRDVGRVQIESRIVHCRPRVRTGIQFVELTEQQRGLISQIARPKIVTARRSVRIPVRLFLELSWIDRGQLLEALAETVLISRHGCLVLSNAPVEVGSSISLRWQEVGIAARARVVSRQDLPGDLPRIAMEFTETDSFWGTYFPGEA